MGAYEGAGVTVLGRGVRAPSCSDPAFRANCRDFWGVNATGGPGAFTDGSVYLGLEHQRLRGQQDQGRRYRLRHQQLLLQPVAYRRPVDHQQLAGRRRHVHPRLGAEPRGREHAHLGQPRHARRWHQPRQRRDAGCLRQRRRRVRHGPDWRQCGHALPADSVSLRERGFVRFDRELGDPVPVEHQGAHPPQHDLQQRVDRRCAVLGHAGRARARSRSARVPTTT